jgi:hypothetical protein
MSDQLFISIDTAPASDNWGFVGRVLVGEHEAYRTIRAYATPGEALSITQRLMGEVLGAMLAGQEWRTAHEEFGHAPRRSELEFGLGAMARREQREAGQPPQDGTDTEGVSRPG